MGTKQATEKERLLIHDGKGIEALRLMQERGLKYTEAVKLLQETRKEINESRETLREMNRKLNRVFRPLIKKVLNR